MEFLNMLYPRVKMHGTVHVAIMQLPKRKQTMDYAA